MALTAVYVSQQFWQDTNIGSPTIPKPKIPPYKTFNLSGDWYITKRLRLIAGLEPGRRKILRSRVRQRHRARTASLRLRWCIPGILTGPGAGENNES